MAKDYKKENKDFYLPKTLKLMHEFIDENKLKADLNDKRSITRFIC